MSVHESTVFDNNKEAEVEGFYLCGASKSLSTGSITGS